MLKENKFLIKRFCLEIAFVNLLILVDLLSKQYIFQIMGDTQGTTYSIVDGIFSFTIVKNYGASFGIFTGQKTFLLVLTSIVTLAIIAFLIAKPKTPKYFRIPMLLIVGGAIGNIYDRAVFGYVRDFIDYKFLYTFFNIDFAVGNIADLYLVVAVFVLITYVFFMFEEKDFIKPRKEKENDGQ